MNKQERLSARNAEIERLVSDGYTKQEVYDGVILSKKLSENTLYAKAWRGSSYKPVFNYKFRTESHMNEHIGYFVDSQKSRAERRAVKKEKRASADNSQVNIGDIYVSCWGYSMSLVDFFQVVGKKGKKTLILKELETSVESQTDHGSKRLLPVKDAFINRKRSVFYKNGEDFCEARVVSEKEAKIAGNHSGNDLDKWDGTSQYFNDWD